MRKRTNKSGTTTTTIQTARDVSQSELVRALQRSISPLFDLLEEELEKSDGQALQIEIKVVGTHIKMNYGVGPITAEEFEA
jgi:hypothetical protein